jgi:hypothetical protein
MIILTMLRGERPKPLTPSLGGKGTGGEVPGRAAPPKGLALPIQGRSGDAGGHPRRWRLRGLPGQSARVLVRSAGAFARRPESVVAHTGEQRGQGKDETARSPCLTAGACAPPETVSG